MQAIDVDRGVTIRQVVEFDKSNPAKFLPDMKYGGLTIYMYKDEPGVYYNAHGKEVPAALAKLAGYDVDRLARLRAKREAVTAYAAQLQAQLELEDTEEEILIKEQGGWKVIALPAGRAKVVDATTGQAVSIAPMMKNEALELLKLLNSTLKQTQQAEKEAENGGTSA